MEATMEDIRRMLDATWDGIGPDALASTDTDHWSGRDVVDFAYSSDPGFAKLWDQLSDTDKQFFYDQKFWG